MRPFVLLACLTVCLTACQTTTPTKTPGGTTAPTGTVAVDPPITNPSPTGSLFGRDAPWTRDVSALPKSSESDAITTGLQSAGGWGGNGNFQTDISLELLVGSDDTPFHPVTPKDNAWAAMQGTDAEFFSPDCDNVPFPLPDAGALEGEDAYACANNGDCHLLVTIPSQRKLFEMWRGDLQGGTLYAGCIAVWDLDKQYSNTLRGAGCTSADAGGFPIAAMLATADEAASGEIKHALRFILPNVRIRDGIYVPPGTHSTGPTAGGPSMPPYGVRFRLKAGFSEDSVTGAGAKAIVRALKKYGMFLADGGNIPLTVASDRFSVHKWATLGFDSHSLNAIAVSDFEVVEYGNPVDYKANGGQDCVRNP